MVTELTLRDGTPAMIWPLTPNDARGLAENYRHLSAESRYTRFLSATRDLSDSMLRRLVDDVDGLEHVALILVVFPAGKDDADDPPELAVGIGRMVRYPDEPTVADVAVTVHDEWRGRGVGSALLAELVAQRPAGVSQLHTQVTTDNKASLALLSQVGAMSTIPAGLDVYEVRVLLD